MRRGETRDRRVTRVDVRRWTPSKFYLPRGIIGKRRAERSVKIRFRRPRRARADLDEPRSARSFYLSTIIVTVIIDLLSLRIFQFLPDRKVLTPASARLRVCIGPRD